MDHLRTYDQKRTSRENWTLLLSNATNFGTFPRIKRINFSSTAQPHGLISTFLFPPATAGTQWHPCCSWVERRASLTPFTSYRILLTRPDSTQWCTWLVCIFNIITFLTTCHKVYPHPLSILMMSTMTKTPVLLHSPHPRLPWQIMMFAHHSPYLFEYIIQPPTTIHPPHTTLYIEWPIVQCSWIIQSYSSNMVIMLTTLCPSTG